MQRLKKNAEILSVQFDDFLEKNLPIVISLWIYKLPRTSSRKTVNTIIDCYYTTISQMMYLKI